LTPVSVSCTSSIFGPFGALFGVKVLSRETKLTFSMGTTCWYACCVQAASV
jgi:hypothetical protein